ncbi:MAG: radical SAM protein [Candidatus Thermoplasmatota archaeon]|nr:radical SAM protein [Candidatus Thermoplasmatota archaeon]
MELDLEKRDIEEVEVNITNCKSALSDSKLESDYSLNPYTGCSHGCRYCYSPYVTKEERSWGEFVDVKRNIPKVLADELKRKEKGTIRIGSVTDPYQKAEEKYKLTRRCLKQLNQKDFPTIIQTKSDLIKRDVNILSDMKADVGFTITSLDDDFRKRFEPDAPPISDRLSAIKGLKDQGVGVWAFIGPLFPYKNDDIEDLERLKDTLLSLGVEEIYLDKLNMREGIWGDLQKLLDKETIERYEDIYFGDDDYFERKKGMYDKIGKTVF